MPSLLSQLFRLFLKIVLGLFAAVLAVSLLAVALIMLALSLLRWLVTGHKPAPVRMFGQFQRFKSQDLWTRNPGSTAPARQAQGEVVDVEVREVREVLGDQRRP